MESKTPNIFQTSVWTQTSDWKKICDPLKKALILVLTLVALADFLLCREIKEKTIKEQTNYNLHEWPINRLVEMNQKQVPASKMGSFPASVCLMWYYIQEFCILDSLWNNKTNVKRSLWALGNCNGNFSPFLTFNKPKINRQNSW